MHGRTRKTVAGTPAAASPEAARAAALRLLKARDRTRAHLARRLREKGFEPAVADAVLDRLEAVGLIDDRATAARLVEREVRRGGASARLLHAKLFQAGVGRETAEGVVGEALAGVDAESVAEEEARRWLSRHAGLEPDAAARRLASRLARRGFDGETVRGVVGRVLRVG